jgi:hypothetical protein
MAGVFDVFRKAEIFITFRDGAHSTDSPTIHSLKHFNRLDVALIWSPHVGSQDPRDKVYALLGLVRREDKLSMDNGNPQTTSFGKLLLPPSLD